MTKLIKLNLVIYYSIERRIDVINREVKFKEEKKNGYQPQTVSV